ncbi:YkgJ family cysteine cluster protein [Seonamhaeicola sp. NFXS20]|uniref:YkgJ family cysteine cluster protein n=1 Tax=Seonamhaeicola sp. NFXS20 TaxID=2816959 RepID=UPI003B8D5737
MDKNTFDLFNEVHSNFKGDTEQTFKVCQDCGGKCEYNKVSSLLPGEAEYMAHKHGISVETFRDKYLDGVMINGEIIDILKCSDPCPFLKLDFSCNVRGYKPIMCLIYPLIFEPDKKGNWLIKLDNLCPLAQNNKTANYFKTDGMKIINDMNISNKWLQKVYEIDEYDYDYKSMVSQRNVPINKYKIFELDELLSYRI